MLPRVTPEEIRREIAGAEERKAKAEQELALLRGLLELHYPRERSIIHRTMEVATLPKSKGAKIAANRSVDMTPSRVACIEKELSDPMIAEFLQCGRSTVQAWHSGVRPIPKEFSDKLSIKWGIDPSVWKRTKG